MLPNLVDHMTYKYFPNIITPQKPRGKGLQQPSLYHGGGVSLHVRPKVKHFDAFGGIL